jgi:mono/diheme cytochrome c family protein
MRRIARLAIVLVTSTLAGAASSSAGDTSATSAPMSRGWKFTEQGGAELFSNICAACHQVDAKGAVGAGAYPPLAEDEKLASADFMLTVLLSGLKSMPSVGDMMSDAQVADVINYVRGHFGNSYLDSISTADVSAARRRLATP